MDARWAYLIGCLLPSLVVIYTDARYFEVSDKVVMFILLSGLLWSAHAGVLSDALLGAGLGFILLIGPCLMNLAGGGDLKYAAALGVWFGPAGLVRILFWAAILGAAWGILLKLRRGRFRAWLVTFLTGLWLRVAYNVRGSVLVPVVAGTQSKNIPAEAVPFCVFMALMAWIIFWCGGV